MKYAVMASLSLDVPAQRDQLADANLARIGSKPTWGMAGIGKGIDRDGKPHFSLEVRFYNKPDALDLFEFNKSRMDAIPVLKGIVSIHDCSHDEGIPRACVIEDKYEK